MIKRILTVTVLISILFSGIAGAQTHAVPIELEAGFEVYSVYLAYDVKTENVAGVSIEFSDAVKNYAFSNFKDGRIWIAIASATAIDLSEPIARISATLGDNKTVAPELERAVFRLNDIDISSTVIFPSSVTAEKTENGISVSITAKDELMRDLPLFIGVYNGGNMLIEYRKCTLEFLQGEQKFDIVLPGSSDAKI